MYHQFVNKIKEIQAVALAKRVEKQNDELKTKVILLIEGLLQEFKGAEPEIAYKSFHEGIHLVYGNSINIKLLIYSSNPIVVIKLENNGVTKDIYHGELHEEQILENIENTLLDWYRTLL